MKVQILQGDVINRLKELPGGSVHCCVTSPPYWALRSYGHYAMQTVWGTMDDFSPPRKHKKRWWTRLRWRAADRGGVMSPNGQTWIVALGLEPTPDLFIQHMVEVFREVRRVLRDDGTLWLNMGSSYASRDILPSQSHSGVPACDNNDKQQLNSKENDRACRGCSDEHQGDSQDRHNAGSHNDQPRQQSSSSLLKKGHDTENVDQIASQSMPPGVEESKHLSSSAASAQNVSSHNREGTCPSSGCLTSDDAFSSSHKSQSGCIDDKCLQDTTLVPHKQDTELSCKSSDISNSSTPSYYSKPYPGVKFKPKDLINMPHLLAEALRADGWYLRSAMPWVKRSAMPESVTDRPASALEYMFLLAKSPKYYFDMEAVRNEAVTNGDRRYERTDNTQTQGRGGTDSRKHTGNATSGRNFRNTDLYYQSIEPPHGMIFAGEEPVGLDVNPQAYSESHFATFPEKLVEPCIAAGTSLKGCCPECGGPWLRVVERGDMEADEHVKRLQPESITKNKRNTKDKGWTLEAGFMPNARYISTTIGWQPSCKCYGTEPLPAIPNQRDDESDECFEIRLKAALVERKRLLALWEPLPKDPCTVLDPFSGACTTGLVAVKMGRDFTGIELNPKYVEMAWKRINDGAGLFVENKT